MKDHDGNTILEQRLPKPDKSLKSPDEMVDAIQLPKHFLTGMTPKEKPTTNKENTHETK